MWQKTDTIVFCISSPYNNLLYLNFAKSKLTSNEAVASLSQDSNEDDSADSLSVSSSAGNSWYELLVGWQEPDTTHSKLVARHINCRRVKWIQPTDLR